MASLAAAMAKLNKKKTLSISPFRLSSLLRLETDPKLALQLFLNPNPETPNPKPFRHSLLSYDLIITKLGRAKLFSELDDILSKLILETWFAPPEIIFCNVITFYSRAGLLDKAMEMYDRIPEFRCQRTVKSMNTLLNGMILCREFGLMRRVFVGFEGFGVPDACTYNIMIKGCRVLGDVEGALKVFDEMCQRGVAPNEVTFSSLIGTLCEGLKLREAFKMKRVMLREHNVRPSCGVYASLIKGLCGVGELTLAVKVKDEMMEKKMELIPAVYSSLIRGLFRLGQKDDVYEMLEEMKRNGCQPDAATYNALLTGFCKEKDFDIALKLLAEMRDKAVKPDCVTYNILILGYCKGERLKEAIDLFKDMPRLGCNPNVVSYTILLDGLLTGLKLEGATTLLDEMIFKGYRPHPLSISRLMGLLLHQGNEDLLLIVFDSLAKANFVDANSWSVAISTVCKNGNLLNLSDIVAC